MKKTTTIIIASSLLIFVFLITVFSIKDDSLTMDELAHLPAGYSYLTQKDMRLNPEHPPLIKDLAAIPLLFIKNINFPSESKAWQEDVNGQWDFGHIFLYESQNPAEKMIFWGRIPMILLLIILGFYIFRWTKELFGEKAGLLALFLFSFSPTFLAHGRLVTTDVGAAAGVFIAIYYFIKALKNPTKKNIILGGVFFGIAELFKFSVILLIPLFGFLALLYWFIKLRGFKETLKILFLVFFIGYLLVGFLYQYHVLNYPPERQVEDAEVFLAAYPDFIKEPLIWAAQKPILRPYAQYFTGLFMVFNRATGGNTTYFMGEISNLGWKHYFPTVYLIKESLTFHILTILALLLALFAIRKPSLEGTKNWLKNHFAEFSMLSFVGIYWAASLTSSLNIGVRHLLPVFPFVMVLVAGVIVGFLKKPYLKLKYILLFVLIIWQIFSVVKVYPHFLAYFNELAGGPDKGYNYTVDSNLDWGQDLKRLAAWVEENNIEKIKIAYFGGSDPKYHLGDKIEGFAWEEPQKGWIAISATLLQGGRGTPIPGFDQSTGYFNWLDNYDPVVKIGYSIFVYHIE
ncbi:MAG: glycosyltransferase family 39 protein [Candidatus Nealsonbacteria bacterium]